MAGATTEARETAQLAARLRALADERRLQIIRLLESGERDAGEIARCLGIFTRSAGRHLSILERCGLLHRSPVDSRRFVLDRHNAALLNASFFSVLGEAGSLAPSGPRGRRRAPEVPLSMTAPEPPQVCLECQNSTFVRSIVNELHRLLEEARRYHSRLQHLSSQVLTAHEAERKRVARELHDDTVQALTSILVRLRLLERSVEEREIKQGLIELRDLTAATLEGVRRLSVDLRPTALDDLGLMAALHSFVKGVTQRWPLRVEITGDGLEGRLPAQVELVLYRVVQEALYNVVKHAQARTAVVRFQRGSAGITVVVEDDGRGFDVEEALSSSERGLGLFGMKERLALVGGSLHIDSAPGRGSRIVAWVPLNRRGRAQRQGHV